MRCSPPHFESDTATVTPAKPPRPPRRLQLSLKAVTVDFRTGTQIPKWVPEVLEESSGAAKHVRIFNLALARR